MASYPEPEEPLAFGPLPSFRSQGHLRQCPSERGLGFPAPPSQCGFRRAYGDPPPKYWLESHRPQAVGVRNPKPKRESRREGLSTAGWGGCEDTYLAQQVRSVAQADGWSRALLPPDRSSGASKQPSLAPARFPTTKAAPPRLCSTRTAKHSQVSPASPRLLSQPSDLGPMCSSASSQEACLRGALMGSGAPQVQP